MLFFLLNWNYALKLKLLFTNSFHFFYAAGSLSTNNTNNNNDSDLELATARSLAADPEDDTVEMVMSSLISDFIDITKIDNVQKARDYLQKSGMNLDQALLLYFEDGL